MGNIFCLFVLFFSDRIPLVDLAALDLALLTKLALNYPPVPQYWDLTPPGAIFLYSCLFSNEKGFLMRKGEDLEEINGGKLLFHKKLHLFPVKTK